MTPAARFPVEPGERVLDLCAAPGGKATALGAALQGKGVLVANDISNSRAKALLKNLEVFGISNAFVTNEVPQNLAERFEGFFDKVLIDAPCSGEGMFRKEEAAVTDWTEDTNAICANRQSEILTSAAKMLRPGGRLIYAVPGPEHLFQMKAVLYEKPYKNPVQEVEYPGFEAVGEREVSGRITVPAGQLEALFAMTPYYWKTPRDGAARLAALPELTTDISFRFLVFEKK